MKKLLTIALLLLTIMSHAQSHETGVFGLERNDKHGFLSVAVDPAMAVQGSEQHGIEHGLDFVVKIGARHDWYQVALFYENFHGIAYHSFGIQPSVVFNPIWNVAVLAGTEVSFINRYGPTALSYALNAEIEYHLKDIFFFAKADLKRRSDISQDWGYSNYVGIAWKF